jgi:ABC-type sugar transport system ATPase subunit
MTIEVVPEVVEELGSEVHVYFSVEAPPFSVGAAREETALLPESKALFSARVDPLARVRVGERVELAIDPSQLHFFDVETGEALPREPAPDEAPQEQLAPATG